MPRNHIPRHNNLRVRPGTTWVLPRRDEPPVSQEEESVVCVNGEKASNYLCRLATRYRKIPYSGACKKECLARLHDEQAKAR